MPLTVLNTSTKFEIREPGNSSNRDIILPLLQMEQDFWEIVLITLPKDIGTMWTNAR